MDDPQPRIYENNEKSYDGRDGVGIGSVSPQMKANSEVGSGSGHFGSDGADGKPTEARGGARVR